MRPEVRTLGLGSFSPVTILLSSCEATNLYGILSLPLHITSSLVPPPPPPPPPSPSIHGRVSGEMCPTVVHPVVGGCVEDPLKGTEPIHNLRVDPELVDEVELTMNHVHRRRYGHT